MVLLIELECTPSNQLIMLLRKLLCPGPFNSILAEHSKSVTEKGKYITAPH